MKKLIPLLILVTLLTACSTKKRLEKPVAEDSEMSVLDRQNYLWAFKPQVNVRLNHSIDSDPIAQLADGDSVLFISNNNGWYQVKMNDNKIGWIRSDLLGPRKLSVFLAAVAFVDSLNEHSDAILYFDKNLYHKRIYLTFSPADYQERSLIEEKTQQIIASYQRHVYSGAVIARVLHPATEAEFLSIKSAGEENADPRLPIIPFGRIEEFKKNNAKTVSLVYSIPSTISDEKILATARNISAQFPLSYHQVQISFKTLNDKQQPQCRFWFKEGQSGEEYKFGICE